MLDAPKLSEILPSSLTSDEKILAAAKFLDNELAKLSGAIKQVLHLPRLEELDSDVLDYLAWQYHVDNYAADYSNEIKRKMIRESIYLHRIKGTPAAVLLAMKAFSDNAEISEWHEYDGAPYFFRVILHDLIDMGDDGKALLRAIYDAKNVRSWLEDITFDFSLEGVETELFHATHEIQGGDIFTDLTLDEDFDAVNFYHAVAEIHGGDIFTDLTLDEDFDAVNFYHAIAELEGGLEITDADFSPPEESRYEWYLRWWWKKFKLNPVVKIYGHNVEPFIDDEDFPDADFLRLYFGFPNNSLRTLTLLNPRKNILPLEINLLGKFSADKAILLNSQGLITDGIRRAILISKHEEVIL